MSAVIEKPQNREAVATTVGCQSMLLLPQFVPAQGTSCALSLPSSNFLPKLYLV